MQVWNVRSKFLGTLQITFDENLTGVSKSGKQTEGAITEIQIFTQNTQTKSVSKDIFSFKSRLTAYENSDFDAFDDIGVAITGTEFKNSVLQQMRRIQVGSVETYKSLAGLAGNPKAYRAVANICATNRIPLILPCHRVVPANLSIGNYASRYIADGANVKTRLLEHENAIL